jgi:hypothetical protein
LYLAKPTHDGPTVINTDEPKRVVMHFIYSKVTHEQIMETFNEGFAKAPNVAAQQANIDKLAAAVPAEVHAGEELTLDYVPGTGTTLLVKGKPTVTIPGTDFMKMVFGVYVGPTPPTEDLKKGLLGG